MKELKCPYCKNTDFEEKNIRRCYDAIIRTLRCTKCDTTFNARYEFQYIAQDSIKRGKLKLKNKYTEGETKLFII